MEPTLAMSPVSAALEDQKLQEEILQLRESRRHTALQLYIEAGKSILLLVAAGLAFLLITRPDSLTNRTSSVEEMRRERARLVIDVIKERDPEIVLTGLMVIRKSYPPADAEWIHEIEKEFTARSSTVAQLIRRRAQLVEQRARVEREWIAEREGTAGTGIPGAGPRYNELAEMLSNINREITELDRMLTFYRGN